MMIKRYLIYISLGGLGCIQTACTDRDSSVPDSSPLHIQADMNLAAAAPRVTDITSGNILDKTAFTANDVISITQGTTTHNYTYTAAGKWEPVTVGQYFTTAGNETYTAHYTRPGSSTDILEDQRTPASFRNCYYYSLSSAAVTLSGSNLLSFTGDNALKPTSARITIHVSYPEERTPVSVTLTGNGIRTGTTGTSETIQCLYMNEPEHDFTGTTEATKAKEQSWTAIIKEKVSLAYTITIKCKVTDTSSSSSSTETEKTGTYAQTAKTLSAGTNYVYNFSFSDYPKLESVQVDDFTSSSGGDIDAGSAH